MFYFNVIMTTLTVFFLSGFLLFTPEAIQEELPVPIDAKEVFTSSDAVKIVETLPLYVADDQRVSFYDYKTKQWHTYPYPPFPLTKGEIATANFVQNDGDSGYTLKVDYYIPCVEDCFPGAEGDIDFTPPRAAVVRERWHFNLGTGKFMPFEAICDDYAHALKGEGEWVLNFDNNQFYICNTETGRSSQPFQLIDGIETPAILRNPSLSPDGNKLAFTFYYLPTLWVYDFQQHKLISLGTSMTSSFSDTGYPLIKWVNADAIIVEDSTSNYGDDHFYLYTAKASSADSLQLFYHRMAPYSLKLSDPLRYVWVGEGLDAEYAFPTPTPSQECTIHEYDPLTHNMTSYRNKGVCSIGWTLPNSADRLGVKYPPESDTSKTLIRFNRSTNLYEEFPVGDLQSVSSISPDGHYVVMTIDGGQYNYQIQVLDLQTKQILKSSQPIQEQFAYVQWVKKDTFRQNVPNGSRFFTISNETLLDQTGKFVKKIIAASPDQKYLLVESNHQALDLLNIETDATTTIGQVPDDTLMEGVWDKDGLVNISIWKKYTNWVRIGHWRIRIIS